MNDIRKAAALVALALAIILAASCVVSCQEEPTAQDAKHPTYSLQLDCSNAAQMHSWGLPTKADVMQWHNFGQWGYYQDGILHAFDDLPGRDGQWDDLYGIEPNPAYDK